MRTQQLFEYTIETFSDPDDVVVFVGTLPYRGDTSPDFEVDVPLLVELLEDYYGVGFHDHDGKTVHRDHHEDQGGGND